MNDDDESDDDTSRMNMICLRFFPLSSFKKKIRGKNQSHPSFYFHFHLFIFPIVSSSFNFNLHRSSRSHTFLYKIIYIIKILVKITMAAMTEAEMMAALALWGDSNSDDDGPSDPPAGEEKVQQPADDEEKKQAEDEEEEDEEQILNTFTVRGTWTFDLVAGREGGNEEFHYGRATSTKSYINGNHRHPNGTVGNILFDNFDIEGNIYATTTKSGQNVRWRVVHFSREEIDAMTINILSAPGSAPGPVDEEDEEKDEEEEECLCCICLVNKADSAPTPCGHVCGCQSCLEIVMGSNRNNCPICRARIEGIQRVHLSVAPSLFRSISQAVAEPFKSYGISRRDARRALDEVDNDIAAAGRRLVQLALQRAQEVDVEGLTAKIVAAREANDCKGVVDAMREGLFSEVVVGKGIEAVASLCEQRDDRAEGHRVMFGMTLSSIPLLLEVMREHQRSEEIACVSFLAVQHCAPELYPVVNAVRPPFLFRVLLLSTQTLLYAKVLH
mgnify:CR=1 FL=1